MKKLLLLHLLSLILAACSSLPQEPFPETPDWVSWPLRTIDHGYLVYVTVGQDQSNSLARLRSEGLAIQMLANECGIVLKGARIEDSHIEASRGAVCSYSKIAVEIADCEAARNAGLEDSQRLVNRQLAGQLSRYHALVETPEPTYSTIATVRGELVLRRIDSYASSRNLCSRRNRAR